MEGDSDANYAYYALHKFKIKPREFIEMDRYEKAFIKASIDIKIEKKREVAGELE